MQAFHFRLEKVIAWRRTELEIEQYKVRLLCVELERIEQSRARLTAERVVAHHEILRARRIDGADLNAHAARLVYFDGQDRTLLRRRSEQEQLIAEAHKRLLEAQRRLRLLEKLRASRHAQWKTELNREIETFAAEAHLARWNRERQ